MNNKSRHAQHNSIILESKFMLGLTEESHTIYIDNRHRATKFHPKPSRKAELQRVRNLLGH